MSTGTPVGATDTNEALRDRLEVLRETEFDLDIALRDAQQDLEALASRISELLDHRRANHAEQLQLRREQLARLDQCREALG